MLAGVSVEYYSRLERGDATGVSESVVEAIARALQLDEAERAHLLDLLRAAGTHPCTTSPADRRAGPIHGAAGPGLDDTALRPSSATARLDILAANALGRALFAPAFDDPTRPPNNARFVFLDPRAGEFFREWDNVANDTVAILRAEAGRDPNDRRLSDLIGELSTRSDEFRTPMGRPQRPHPRHRRQS